MTANLVQHPKAYPPILDTLSGMVVEEQPCIKVLLLVSTIALHPLRESYMLLPSSTIMVVRLLQRWKTPSPILDTLLGIVMMVRMLQPSKAESPIVVTFSGRVMAVRLLHSQKAPALMLAN
jgi:hypothetical protein